MMTGWLQTLCFAGAATGAVTGGALYAFSAFGMPALRTLPASEGVSAMQALNLAAPRVAFMIPLVGSVVICLGLLVASGAGWGGVSGAGRLLILVGSATGLAAFAVTAGFHVPRNNALATLSATAPETAGAWADYARSWTAMNHVRVALLLTSAGTLVAAVVA